MELVEIARWLRDAVSALSFAPPVSHVYNPLEYAWEPHRRYLQRYGGGRPQVVMVGMNPGPFGMVQTGVPFGDVEMVRDWLKIRGRVARPACEHPKRPVQGFDCPRREISGQRLWGWARSTFTTPECFFSRFFVANHCPLSFMEASGRNRTPDRLPAAERAPLFALCDRALGLTLTRLAPEFAVGVGQFAAQRLARVVEAGGAKVGAVPHPSPASPVANRDWAGELERALSSLGITLH